MSRRAVFSNCFGPHDMQMKYVVSASWAYRVPGPWRPQSSQVSVLMLLLSMLIVSFAFVMWPMAVVDFNLTRWVGTLHRWQESNLRPDR